MTVKEILGDNRLIAEFMGGNIDNDGIELKNFGKLSRCYLIDELKFHKSWDWLMPVVEKIESLGVSTNIHYFAAPKKNSSGYYSTEFLGYTQILSSFDSSNIYQNKLESVYHMVIHFIKWYNDNK